MTNPYYTFAPALLPGTRARSEEINVQYTAIQQAFDLLPTPPDTLSTGRATVGVETGSGNAFQVTMNDTRTENQEGDEVVFLATHDNTDVATLKVDGLAAVALLRYNGNPLQAGDIVTGSWYDARYSLAANKFYIISPALSTIVGNLVYAAPTSEVGLVAAGGVLTTVLRSDATLALDQGIVPTWTGLHTFNGDAVFNGTTTFNGAIFGGSISSSTFAPDGTVGAPSISFASDTDTGFYRIGANNFAITTAGVLRWQISDTAITPALPTQGAAGSAGTPAYSFSGDSDTGMYNVAANDLGFATNGVLRFDISTLAVSTTLPVRASAGTAIAPAYSFSADDGTGIYDASIGTLAISTSGVLRFTISSTAATFVPPIQAAAGAAATPSVSFSGDTNTGMYSVAADDLGFTTGGVLRLDISTTVVTSTLVVRGPAGSAAAPAYSFSGDSNTGVYAVSADVLGLTAGGVLQVQVLTNGAAVSGYLSAGTAASGAAGDITAARNTTTGVIFLGSNGTHYLYFDGANYILPSGDVFANGVQLAGLNSPHFAGTPTAPALSQGNNSTALATTSYVDAYKPTNLSTASGSAPSYSARAFGRFTNNSSGTTIKVANCSIARNSTGLYTISFTTAMPDGSYIVVFGTQQIAGNPNIVAMIAQGTSPSASSFQIEVVNGSSRIETGGIVSFAIFG